MTSGSRHDERLQPGEPTAQHVGAETGFPSIAASIYATPAGTPYLREPGVAVLARPDVSPGGLADFLNGFDPGLRYPEYLSDPDPLTPGVTLCKVAGQLCYMSFGPRRTRNADAQRYFGNIIESGHGSVLEHACYTFLCYGVSRSLTHELVRHRAGFGFSQVSQRYVSGRVLRFVERPEFAAEPAMHAAFEARIDRAAQDYNRIAGQLAEQQQAGAARLSGEARTDLRKKVQQAARAALPNETEAPIIVTANIRAWRHFIAMRGSAHAEVEIRCLAYRIYLCLAAVEPVIFHDFRVSALPDGTHALETDYPKV